MNLGGNSPERFPRHPQPYHAHVVPQNFSNNTKNLVRPEKEPLIIDVSTYQGVISWPTIKADAIELAIIKATEGIGFRDPNFDANWAGAKAAGVPRGAYAFARPDAGNDPITEADWFLSVVQPQPGDVLALDYEVSGGGAAWCLAWLDHVLTKSGIRPRFYSNYNGCSRVASDPRMATYALWLAYPGDGLHPPACPTPWSFIDLWQYAVGTVPGITGNVDEDVNLGRFAMGGGFLLGGNLVDLLNLKAAFVDLAYAAFFGRPADPGGDPGWITAIKDDLSNLDAIISQLRDSPEAVAYRAKLAKAFADTEAPQAADDDSAYLTKAALKTAIDSL